MFYYCSINNTNETLIKDKDILENNSISQNNKNKNNKNNKKNKNNNSIFQHKNFFNFIKVTVGLLGAVNLFTVTYILLKNINHKNIRNNNKDFKENQEIPFKKKKNLYSKYNFDKLSFPLNDRELKKILKRQMELEKNTTKINETSRIILLNELMNSRSNHPQYSPEEILNTTEWIFSDKMKKNLENELVNIHEELDEINFYCLNDLKNKMNNIKNLGKIQETLKKILHTIETNMNLQNSLIIQRSNEQLIVKIAELRKKLHSIKSDNLYSYIMLEIMNIIGLLEATMYYNKNEKFSNKINDLLNELIHNIFLNDSEITDNIEDPKNNREDSKINTMDSKKIFKERILLEIEYYSLQYLRMIHIKKYSTNFYSQEEYNLHCNNLDKNESIIYNKLNQLPIDLLAIENKFNNIRDFNRIKTILNKIANTIYNTINDMKVVDNSSQDPNLNVMSYGLLSLNHCYNKSKKELENININTLMNFLLNCLSDIIGRILEYKKQYDSITYESFKLNINNLLNELLDLIFD